MPSISLERVILVLLITFVQPAQRPATVSGVLQHGLYTHKMLQKHLKFLEKEKRNKHEKANLDNIYTYIYTCTQNVFTNICTDKKNEPFE